MPLDLNIDPLLPGRLGALGFGLVAVLAIVQLGLLLWALIRLAGTPDNAVSLPKWAWALIIIFASTVGPIAFLVAGRREPEHFAPPTWQGHASAASAADLLYGAPARPFQPGDVRGQETSGQP